MRMRRAGDCKRRGLRGALSVHPGVGGKEYTGKKAPSVHTVITGVFLR